MNGEAYIAQAAALQAAAAIREDSHLFCDQLPSMDVDRFVEALATQTADPSDVSLALVGYRLSETDLRDRLNAHGFPVGHVTTDLHVAAKWRNDPSGHPKIIALATGRYPGISTLAHFRRSDPRELALDLLRWARTAEPQLASTPPQRDLLEVLAKDSFQHVTPGIPNWRREIPRYVGRVSVGQRTRCAAASVAAPRCSTGPKPSAGIQRYRRPPPEELHPDA